MKPLSMRTTPIWHRALPCMLLTCMVLICMELSHRSCRVAAQLFAIRYMIFTRRNLSHPRASFGKGVMTATSL